MRLPEAEATLINTIIYPNCYNICTTSPIDALVGSDGLTTVYGLLFTQAGQLPNSPYHIYIIPHFLQFVKNFFYLPMNNAIVCSSIPYLVEIAG